MPPRLASVKAHSFRISGGGSEPPLNGRLQQCPPKQVLPSPHESPSVEGAHSTARGDPERAARLLGGAAGLREQSGFPVPAAEADGHARAVATVQTALGAEAYGPATTAGRAMPVDGLVAEALGEEARPPD